MSINNSLSELMSDNWDFNRLKGEEESATSRLEVLQKEIQKQRERAATSASPQERTFIAGEINKLEAEVLLVQNEAQRSNNRKNKSLFDQHAYLDYGRYNTNQRWYENKSANDATDTTRLFTTNQPENFNIAQPVPITKDLYTDGLTINELVKWSEGYPALQLRFQDFVFCRNVGVYPNNRLVVLRRFRNGVPDNLFDFFRNDEERLQEYARPVSTMVTWWKPDTPFLSFTFSEGWDDKAKGDFFANLANKDNQKKEEGIFDFSLYNMSENAMFFALLRNVSDTPESTDPNVKWATGDDKVGNFLNEPGGNPNLIRNAALRKTGGGGLESSITFTLDFDFEMRLIKNIDPGIAMLDLISNCLRMGTSVAQFRMDYALLKEHTITRILNGDYEVNLEKMFNNLKENSESLIADFGNAVANIGKSFMNTFKDAKFIDVAGTVIDGASRHIISRYRENIKHALAAETGLPSGKWHVTIGNPKAPIVSCGDLIISTSTLTLGKELGFNDFPTTFRYSITLKSARERGRNELERIFNAGRGRVYVYRQPAQNPDYGLKPPL